MMRRTTVLVAGAGGQVGRRLLASAPREADVVACDRRALDIADAAAIGPALERIQPDVIINAAAYTAVDRAESEPEVALATNATGPENLALAARELGARVLHISTDYVFDGRGSRPYLPDDQTGPLGVYGRTKLQGEAAVIRILSARATVVRTSWLYDAQGHNFFNTMLRLMSERGSVRVVNDQIGSPTAVGSLCRVLWKFALAGNLGGRIYHWTDGGAASWFEFARAIARQGAARGLLADGVAVTPISTFEYPTPARRPPYSLLDCRSTVSALGLSQRPWEEELGTVCDELAALRRH
jgi:dTDP-4-dehydrorhamnose reductase